jgi:spore maturation protein CgeB
MTIDYDASRHEEQRASDGARLKILCVLGASSYGDPARGATHEFANFLPAFRHAGHEVRFVESFLRRTGDDFASLNLELVQEAISFRPDVIFFVLMGYEIWTETLDLLRAHSPVITINWGTDDSWKFDQVSRFLAPHLDFHVTTYASAYTRAHALGSRNVLQSQWGVSEARLSEPVSAEQCEYDVSFVGQLYGERRAWIEGLRQRGIHAEAFGHGSERGPIAADEVANVYRRSRISLNFSDAGHRTIGRPRDRQIKARIFEVTGAGGFLLTENVDGLSDNFQLGREIDVFTDLDGLAEKIRLYLAHPELRDSIAQAGHLRTHAEHTYTRRFASLLAEALSRFPSARRQTPWTLAPHMLEPHVARHRNKRLIGPLRAILERPAQAVFGNQRGSRAARRLMFELSWRICGERTFSATGLPGRLFYRES